MFTKISLPDRRKRAQGAGGAGGGAGAGDDDPAAPFTPALLRIGAVFEVLYDNAWFRARVARSRTFSERSRALNAAAACHTRL